MRFESPTTTKEAAALLAGEKGDAYILAGGTDLLVRMKTGLIEPDLVVDIKRIPATHDIKVSDKGISIGAAVSGAEMNEHAKLKKAWPGVVEAANLIGSDQIQGRCTVAGNLCNASPAADSVPALIAAAAKAVIVGEEKRRTVAVEKIITGPGRTSLQKGELIESIQLPKRPPRSGDAYLRFIPRTEMDIAVVGVGINLSLERGLIKSARVVLGAVAPTPVLVPKAAKAIIGTKLDAKALENLAAACSEACNPIDDKRGTIEYRTRVAGVLARRAAVIAFKRAGGA
ncbi:MAG: xanthine dehydrogenase family protein subunit M [Gammaproteobacteria bacterium]|jgi:aerobic carbon-monoxide dehydrogenase medium subunit|nr:xanthine dehydrogenase family protein subunit M [Gammaproteobacteria bacterium]MBT5203608.1 xanthine dehydrogenase family protein subunit M [Gammaproteobacteria bacterium]MBT6245402.1 xanthine dehydrogenase family protein subunit M [Gammaproteobacteria bacterium]